MIGPDPNFKVFNEDIEIRLKEIGDSITARLPAGWAHTLLLYNFGPKGNLFYTSNGNREDMIKMLEEFTVMLKNQDKPAAPTE